MKGLRRPPQQSCGERAIPSLPYTNDAAAFAVEVLVHHTIIREWILSYMMMAIKHGGNSS